MRATTRSLVWCAYNPDTDRELALRLFAHAWQASLVRVETKSVAHIAYMFSFYQKITGQVSEKQRLYVGKPQGLSLCFLYVSSNFPLPVQGAISAAHCAVWESMEPVLPAHVGVRCANSIYKSSLQILAKCPTSLWFATCLRRISQLLFMRTLI